MFYRIKSKGDPYILVKNRDEVVQEQLDEYGYHFCLVCQRSRGFYKLHVHHIIYRSEAPGHPQLHCKENLLICCNDCHDELHDDKKKREPIVEERGLKLIFINIFIEEKG